MTTKYLINVILGFTIISCTSKEKAQDQISGTYALEVSFPVKNLQSGKEIGASTIRDTIIIQLVGDGYAVSNRKWKLNDYDKEGWQRMEHSEDRPLPDYIADFIEEDAILRSRHSDLIAPLYVDIPKQTIFRSKIERRDYHKVR